MRKQESQPRGALQDHTSDNDGRAPKRSGKRSTRLGAAYSALVLLLAACATASLLSTAATIKRELSAASDLVPKLKSKVLDNDAEAAKQVVSELEVHTSNSRKAASDPLWNAASSLPFVGANFEASTTAATAADDVVRLGAIPLTSVFSQLDWKRLLPGSDDVDLKGLAAAKDSIASAAHAVRQSSDRMDDIKTEELLPQISGPMIEAKAHLNSLREGLDTAADVAELVPQMMGAESPRQYLLLIQNNAEVRASGGIPGALAVLTLDGGRLSLSEQDSASNLGVMSPIVPVEAEQKEIYSGRIGKFMQDVNLTPDFPTSAEIAQTMWEQKRGKRLDGVISIDPVSLGYILDATGPVRLATPELQGLDVGDLPAELTGKNVVSALLSDVYSQISEPFMQDLYFAHVGKEVLNAVDANVGDPKNLMSSLTRSVAEDRIRIWSAVATEEAVLARYSLGGAISGPAISPAQFGVYFNDGTGAKMDYHVKRTVQLIEQCPTAGYGQVKVRVTSTNTAPRDAAVSLPEYVTGGGAFGVPAGTVQTNIVAYGPVQSHVEAAVADGKKISFASQLHSGRPVGTVTVALPPGKSSTIEFTFGKIVQHTEPALAVTPTVQSREDVVLDTVTEKCVPAE